ncbi:CoA pyrophosphatase, partial [bacterium]|nr:CoA pyrophosphatase [bacterium]
AQKIKSILADYSPKMEPAPPGFRAASVLIPFYSRTDDLSLIFMKRPDYPGAHGGQISFPGGGIDEKDEDNLSAALRETEEEIGVNRNVVEVWGGLNTKHTRVSKYWVTPFVGRVPYPYDFDLCEKEVERLLIIPFSHLLDPKTFSVDSYNWKGYDFQTYIYKCGEDIIWGLTARILNNFISLLTQGRESDA